MKGLLVLCLLGALALTYGEDVAAESAKDTIQHDWDHHDHDWDHHDHDWDHHDHDHDWDWDDHKSHPFKVCAKARANRFHFAYGPDSHKFIKCDLNTHKGTLFTCPSGLVFNPAIQVCDYP